MKKKNSKENFNLIFCPIDLLLVSLDTIPTYIFTDVCKIWAGADEGQPWLIMSAKVSKSVRSLKTGSVLQYSVDMGPAIFRVI